MFHRKGLRAILLAGVLAVAVAPGVASADDRSTANEGGWGALAAVSSLIYGPLKVVYATTGLIIGGLAWGVSGGDSDVMYSIVVPAVRGDYVVTPKHVRGEKSIEFIGRDPQYRSVEVAETPPVVQQDYQQDYLVEETY